MDVINISGVQFRMRPDITVRKVLEVFRGLGREGVLQRNGVVEFLDSPIEFNPAYAYEFVDSSEFARAAGLLDMPFPEKSLYAKSMLDMPTALLDQPLKYILPSTADYQPTSTLFKQTNAMQKPTRLISQPIELINQQQDMKLYDDARLKASIIQEPTAILNQPIQLTGQQQQLKLYNEALLRAKGVSAIAERKALMRQPLLIGQSEKVFYQPTAMLDEPIDILRQQERMKLYNDAALKESLIQQPTTFLNQPIELMGQRELKLYNDDILNNRDMAMIAARKALIQQSRTPFDMYPTAYIEPKFYQFVVLKARQNNYLNLDNIEVYNVSGQNIVNRAGVFSDACIRAGLMPYYRKFLGQREILRSATTGAHIRLRFDDNRYDSISKVVLRNAQNEIQFNRLLTGAMLEVRKVNEYTLDTDSARFSYINSYPNMLINAIEIRAPTDRLLRLNKIRVIDDLEQTIDDIISFDSSDLAITRRDVTAQQLLFQNEEMTADYIQSAIRGGYIRLTLARPMRVKALQLVGALRGLKVTMESLRSYTCSDDYTQNFSF